MTTETPRTETRKELAGYIVTVFRAIFHLDDNAPAERYARVAAERLIKLERTLSEREGQIRECVELLERGRAAINHVGVVTGADEWTEQCDALLARLKEKP